MNGTTKKQQINSEEIYYGFIAGERMEEFRADYIDLIGREPDYRMDISSIVAMSAGIGVVAIALTTK